MRTNARSPIIPLSFDDRVAAVRKELLIDYEKNLIYIVSPDNESIMINVTESIKNAVISHMNEWVEAHPYDVTDTSVTIEGVGTYNLATLLKVIMSENVSAIPDPDNAASFGFLRTTCDNVSIKLNEGVAEIAGFGNASKNQVPVKNASGVIDWKTINPDNVTYYTTNKGTIASTPVVGGIINLTDNPINKADISGNVYIRLPIVATDYACVKLFMHTDSNANLFADVNSVIVWDTPSTKLLLSDVNALFTFETFDMGVTWFGRRNILSGLAANTKNATIGDLASYYTIDEINSKTNWFGENNYTRFRRMTLEEYNNLEVRDISCIYFITDAKRIYLDGELYCQGEL